MAGVTSNETTGAVVKAMWVEAGIQFRSNLLQPGQRVDLHQHSYDHVMLVHGGSVAVREVRPDGTERRFILPSPDYGYRMSMPAYHQHEITGLTGLAEVLCFWPAVTAQDHVGC